MEFASALRYLDIAARAGIRGIVFNGGEPTLHYPEMLSLVRAARSLGLSPSLFTNGSWASSTKRARALLSDFKTAGLKAITLSADRFHLVQVPTSTLVRALRTAREVGLNTGVKIARLQPDPIADGLHRDLLPVAGRIMLQQVSPVGRASALRESLRLKPIQQLERPGCLTPPVLLPDGNLLTCCNLPARDLHPASYPFVLGNLKGAPLDELLAMRARHPLLAFIRRHGPAPFLSAVAADRVGPQEGGRSHYHDGCELCFHLLQQGAPPVRLRASPDPGCSATAQVADAGG